MCGRVIQHTPLGDIRVLFETANPVPNAAPTYNGAPTDLLPVVRLSRAGSRSLDLLRWGLIPYWAKDRSIAPRCINARAETLATMPAFREAFRRGRRCLVPIDGFYEWKKLGGERQPYAVAAADRRPLALAGLWERWQDPVSREIVQSLTIVTTPPNALCGQIHDRMPAILPRDAWPLWLGEAPAAAGALLALLSPYPAERMTMWPVGKRVGNVRNNEPALLDPIAAPPAAPPGADLFSR